MGCLKGVEMYPLTALEAGSLKSGSLGGSWWSCAAPEALGRSASPSFTSWGCPIALLSASTSSHPPMGSDIPLLPSSTNAEPFLSPTPQLGICGWNQLAHVSFSSGNPCLQGSMKIAGERALPEAPSFRPAPTVTKTFHFPGQGP